MRQLLDARATNCDPADLNHGPDAIPHKTLALQKIPSYSCKAPAVAVIADRGRDYCQTPWIVPLREGLCLQTVWPTCLGITLFSLGDIQWVWAEDTSNESWFRLRESGSATQRKGD
jgi:hypothetical protein